ncbi:hypothetical protein [Sinosporangium siamense]|uniref:Uncharacterized protein n=1 Tax=Sinosporangium siamense TaxID=1367973 RepID=A0A919RPC0_9ACTN|nr:hypothetical protein [Sinosporangium siamense]GII96807.1 hypothetical protein Ssi02_70380 [Sinosporangium siamense]
MPLALPAVTPFIVEADEPARDVKRAAVRYLEALLTYPAGGGSVTASRSRLAGRGLAANGVATAAPLLDSTGSGTVQVIYPQLGGLTADRASIMAVARVSTLRGRRLSQRTRVLDLRLAKREGRWLVTGLSSTGGRPPSRSTSGDLADRVLSSRKIVLSDTSAWDIQAGRVDDRLLRLLLRLSRKHTLSVCVLSTGHPQNVFGGTSVSNHIRGRAVDIWAIDGTRVSAYARRPDGERNPAWRLMSQAMSHGANEIGGPWAFAGRYGASFTNTVHQDHLHLGFKR